MSLTIGNWIVVGIIALLLLICTVWAGISLADPDGIEPHYRRGIIAATICLAVSVGLTFGAIKGMDWWNTNTASGIRGYKDFQSEMDNGIYREIVITAEDGREIFRYEGHFDVERHADGDDRYLRFESEDGKRYTISYGIQDSVFIIEKDKKQ